MQSRKFFHTNPNTFQHPWSSLMCQSPQNWFLGNFLMPFPSLFLLLQIHQASKQTCFWLHVWSVWTACACSHVDLKCQNVSHPTCLNFMAIDQGLWKSIDSESKKFILLLKMESKYPPKHPAVDRLRWKIPLAEKSSFVSILGKKSTNQVVINDCEWSSVHAGP